ncbi:uncharacterized protein MELLADRAFT_59308 [Melampsora larici-populina 98AG31]|uniref:Uncharacterized protein n=1 Tax=Melampsora larici-populina (strain 98AG31 / pathotype 3-4-7) TaxID=747676 RepID=F4R5U3_MELLP|nr:uncharacterized protein MELLADRAFT_59308 [Melampsora larici-populina 98AG31]EGG12099.1 hypothetical protein MELLADRAFT_59308 [Melampsora larici-populina 98AG31]
MIQNSTETRVKDMKTPCADSHTAANNVRNSQNWRKDEFLCRDNINVNRRHVKEEQKLELGQLLYYEEMAKNECTRLILIWLNKDSLDKHSTHKKKIKKQRAKIGSEAVLNDLNVITTKHLDANTQYEIYI